MNRQTIGILLSETAWKKTFQRKMNRIDEYRINQYVKRGDDLDLQLLFFNVAHLNFENQTGHAFEISKNQLIEYPSMAIPSIFYNPSNYRQLKEQRSIQHLAAHQGVTVINERPIIKKKHLQELLAAKPEFMDFVQSKHIQVAPITFTILGQKSLSTESEWDFPILYAKVGDKVVPLKAIKEVLDSYNTNPQEVETDLLRISQPIFELIHYYYPGIHEIGLQFTLNMDGEFRILATCSIDKMLKDLSKWEESLRQQLIHRPIELARHLLQRKQILHDLPLITSAKVEGKTEKQKRLNYWVKLSVFHEEMNIIKIPNQMGEMLRDQPKSLKFGVKDEVCFFEYYEDPFSLKRNSFHTPAEIFISTTLSDQLHIPEGHIFQLHFNNGKAILGPTIGFLLGEKNHMYNLNYMEKFLDRLGEYDRFGGTIIAFSTRSVNWDENIAHGFIYDPNEKKWKYGSTAIPATIYRRNFHQDQGSIQALIKLTNNQVFNSYHFKKSDLYFLKHHPELKQHLPETFLLKNPEALFEFVREQRKVIIKPISLSRGRGIYIVENKNQDGTEFVLSDYSFTPKVQYRTRNLLELKELLNKLGVLSKEYLYQTYIPLLKVNNRALDVRVVMQKFNKNEWMCSGIECRVAGEDEELTNIARGGEAMELQEVIKRTNSRLSYLNVYRSILNLCYKFCELMDESDHHYAEFGIDIALDEEGYPWILEANIYPSFKGFKILDYQKYLKIRYQPIFYAVEIQGFQIFDTVKYTKNKQFQGVY
ncbi:YheC/YheD family protein [Neobacillus sp. LXY-1]|uniref:YheC/YheD family endospore coat-associated protein n=1 Tax=Neobacillus sp. LXY-1 TaxID=3379133 RepID=UPI003EDE8C80